MIVPKFDSKAPAAGIPFGEAQAFYNSLGRERYALVCLESVERTTKLDTDADDAVKLRVVAIELPSDEDAQTELSVQFSRLYRARTADGTLDEVDGDAVSALKDTIADLADQGIEVSVQLGGAR
jgi:hypothetical protein